MAVNLNFHLKDSRAASDFIRIYYKGIQSSSIKDSRGRYYYMYDN